MKFDLNNPRTLATTGMMTALVIGLTMIHLSQTPTGGYIHLGDIAIYFTAFAFGPWAGLVAGGVGTGLADVIAGAPQWAPLSFVVHGLQGLVAGWIVSSNPRPLRLGLAILAGGLVVVGGYFLGEAIVPIYGGYALALGEIPGNIVQELLGAVGAVVYVAVADAYPRIRQVSHS
jgi:uncharacterized membrane protein